MTDAQPTVFQITREFRFVPGMIENDRHRACCIGVADSIMQRLGRTDASNRWSDDELRDIYLTLSDIEHRLYQKGEYHPSNVAALPPIR
jgi:hypothetical protein